ncbi:MAG: DPP IV N-terminal domain-containing protein [Gemmatimonadota bacterium]
MPDHANRSVRRGAAVLSVAAFVALAAVLAPPAAAQQTPYAPRTVTAAQYAHAEQFLAPNTAPLVFGASARPVFVDANRFWYRSDTPMGSQFVLVDPARKSRKPAFDHAKVAAALSAVTDTTYDAYHLPFRTFEYTADFKAITFSLGRRQFTCDVQGAKCEAQPRQRLDRNMVVSPDGRKAVFIRDWNLWMRDLATGKETQLTSDGVENYGYATDNAGWTRSDRPIVLWSPDSRRIATFQQDQRRDGEMYVVSTEVGHPTLQAWKYPLPGDSVVSMIERVIIDVGGADGVPSMVRLKMPPDQHRSTICDDIACRGSTFTDVEWSPDASKLFFVSTSRDHKHETLREADAGTGDVRDILEESVPTFYESGYNAVNWRVLPASNEVIWYSERTNWGHLYLYDLRTGQLKHAITSGDWNVLQVRNVDPRSRTSPSCAASRARSACRWRRPTSRASSPWAGSRPSRSP